LYGFFRGIPPSNVAERRLGLLRVASQMRREIVFFRQKSL
jgi:hypothetical protein